MKSPQELRFISTVKREGILPAGSCITAAVSGGADSICMLHMMMRFRKHMSWSLSVLHIDHSYRKSSGTDAEFVRSVATSLDLPFILRRFASRIRKNSPEADFSAARQAVYEEVAGDGLVAVAHTASDRAETLLMRLLEGAGLRGLGGMDYFGVGPVRRPMLDLTAYEIRQYLAGRNHAWVEDETNAAGTFLRNRIRHGILEPLESEFPGVSRRIASSSANLGSWRRVAEGLPLTALGQLSPPGCPEGLSRQSFQRYERALRLSMLWEICGRPRGGAAELEKADSWIQTGGEGEKLLPGGTILSAGRDLLVFTKSEGGRWR